MNSRVDPEVICGPLSQDGVQDRASLVVEGRVDQPIGAALDRLQEPFGGQRVGEDDLDLGGGLLCGDDVGQPLAGHEILHDGHRHPGSGEVGRVVDPQLVRAVVHPLGEGLAHRGPRPPPWVQNKPVSGQNPLYRGR
jgi:hypothetical protein